MDFSKQLFRCSSLGNLMSDPRSGSKDELSEGAKTHLCDIYTRVKYDRTEEVSSKFIEKGLVCEEDSVTLYSRVTKNFYIKNDKRLQNGFITGEPDLFKGKSIADADEVSDIKTSWSLYTFLRTFTKKTNSNYYWQGQGYLWLTGAELFKLAYCLVDTPEPLIQAEIRKNWYKMGQPDESLPAYVQMVEQTYKNMTYEDIPLAERVLEYPFQKDADKIERIKGKVIKGRDFLNILYNDLKIKQAN